MVALMGGETDREEPRRVGVSIIYLQVVTEFERLEVRMTPQVGGTKVKQDLAKDLHRIVIVCIGAPAIFNKSRLIEMLTMGLYEPCGASLTFKSISYSKLRSAVSSGVLLGWCPFGKEAFLARRTQG